MNFRFLDLDGYHVYANGCKTVRVVTHNDTHFQHSQFHIMFLSLHTMLHSYVHVTGNAGWAGVGWGGDVNVRLKLNTPLMLR